MARIIHWAVILFFLGGICLGQLACEDEVYLSRSDKHRIDTIHRARIEMFNVQADSLCGLKYDSLFSLAYDSILESKQEQIRKLMGQ